MALWDGGRGFGVDRDEQAAVGCTAQQLIKTSTRHAATVPNDEKGGHADEVDDDDEDHDEEDGDDETVTWKRL